MIAACQIENFSLYRLVEREIRARDSPITCWARSIAVFVYHARQQLKKGKLTDQKILGGNADFRYIALSHPLLI